MYCCCLFLTTGLFYFRRPLKLHELLEELEIRKLENPNELPIPPDGIILFPPVNANDDLTDCDSGDEDFTTINNLPGSQLRNDVEVIVDNYDIPLAQASSVDDSMQMLEDSRNASDSEDDIPLAQLFPGAALLQ
jgi:hypothetical protein